MPREKLSDEERHKRKLENQKRYYQKNREQLRQKHREYAIKNRGKRKLYEEEHKEEISKYKKEWALKNKEKIKLKNQERYENNKEEIKSKVGKYKKSFIGAVKAKIVCSKQEDLKYNRDNDIDEYFVKHLLEIQDFKCLHCNKNVKLDWADPYDKEQFSINRLNNNIGHTQNNCEITCWGCNDYLGRLDKIKNK